MTADTEQKIAQREAMIALARATMDAAQKAADATKDERVKAGHLSQVYLRKQRIDELEKQIRDLKGISAAPIIAT